MRLVALLVVVVAGGWWLGVVNTPRSRRLSSEGLLGVGQGGFALRTTVGPAWRNESPHALIL